MNNKSFSRLHRSINRVAEIIAQMPLAEYLEELNRADIGGPVTNPALHIKAAAGLENMRVMAGLLLVVKEERVEAREGYSEQVNQSNAIAAQAWLQNLGV